MIRQLSGSLSIFGVALFLAACASDPGAAVGAQKIGGKAVVPPPQKVKPKPFVPFPGHSFSHYGNRSMYGYGSSHLYGMPFGFAHSLPALLHSLPGHHPLGAMPGSLEWPLERREHPFEMGEAEEWLLFGAFEGMMPGIRSMRSPVLRAIDPNLEVLELLAQVRGHGRAVQSSMFLLGNDLIPGLGGSFRSPHLSLLHEMGLNDPFSAVGLPGILNPRGGMPRTVEPHLLMMDRAFGADALRAIHLLDYGRGGFNSSWNNYRGILGVETLEMQMGLGMGMYPSLYPGRFDPLQGLMGFPRYRYPLLPASRYQRMPISSRPASASPDEQRAALAKVQKSLVAVEAMARVGAWSELGASLEKIAASNSASSGWTAPLRAIQTEAARLDDLLKLRQAITSVWTTAPDAATLTKQLEATRLSTGDRELADRLKRLLAVKASWEGHDATAVALVAGPEGFDMDAELGTLQVKHLTNPERATPIVTDDDRVVACRRVVRGLLEGIDRHLDCGRSNVAVQLQDVRSIRSSAAKSAKALSGSNEAKPVEGETFEMRAEAVGKTLGRELTPSDRVILRQMHTAKKSLEEMVETLR